MEKIKRMRKILCLALVLFLALPPVVGDAAEKKTADVVIDVTDYGADPTGVNDSAVAIWEAFEAAKEASEDGTIPVTVNFPTGEYHIYKDYAQTREYHTSNTNSIENPIKTIGLLIENQKNLTIEGNGSLFMMHGNMMALAVAHSENITLHDFSWDFAVPTVTEMTVTAVGSNYTDYYIPACFPHTVSGNSIYWSSDLSPYTGQPYWSGSNHDTDGHGTYAVVGYHPDDEMTRNYYPSDGPLSNVSSIEELSDTSVRVYYSSRSSAQSINQKVGTVFELCSNAHRQTAGAFTYESKNVTSEEINVHFMHGFGWLIQMSEDVYYKKCNLVPRENSGHITVSFADGIHASGAAGEIVIEDCNFANTHDDPINLHGTFTRVEERNDDNTLTLKYIHTQQGGFPQYHVGDKVQFFTRDTLESTDGEATYTVAEVVSNPGEDSNDLRTMVIRFKETLPTNLSDTISGEPKYVAENVTYAPSVTIRNCTFKNVPTRGILCTTRNKVLIENNVFYNMSMATIFLSNDSGDWYESGPIRDMTIKGNTFYIKDIGRTSWTYASAIYVHPVTKGGGLPDASNPIHKNITIEDNTFYMDLDTVVKAESVENLTFRNNKVYRMNPDVEIDIALADTTISEGETEALTVNATGNTNDGTIDNVFNFTKCKNVLIEGNTYDDGLKLYAVTDQATIDNGITVNDEEITIVSGEGNTPSTPVSDICYASSNPEVVTVDCTGNVTGVAAGKATIFAYYKWNDTIIRSNEIEVTVSGTSVAGTIEIVTMDNDKADNTEVNMKTGASVQFKEKDDNAVTWSVVDFETEGTTDKAVISSDGTLTAVEEGVVWVKASTEAATDKAAVVIYGGSSYGLNEDFSITREDTANYSYDADSITITAQSDNDLWQWDNNLENLFLYNPSVEKDNLRALVKVENMPVRESNKWDTASFILYSGDDDYYTIGKKSHYDGFATVKEKAQSATEVGGDSAHNSVSTAWLGISKAGDTITLDYSIDGTTWNTAQTYTDGTFGDDYKIGFGTWGTTRNVTFSEFKVGSADSSYADLMKADSVSITKTVNQRPTVSDVSVSTSGTTATVDYTFGDADGDSQGTTLFRWTYEEDGKEVTTVTSVNNISVAGISEISCQVYPIDAYGTPGTPSKVKTASFASESITDLYSVAFNGDVVFERNDVKDVIVKIPDELEKVEMTYVSVNNSVGDVEISKNGTKLNGTYKNSDRVILAVADGDNIVITRGGVDYTFTIDVIGSDTTTVENIQIEALGLDVTPAGEKAFYLNADSTKGNGTIVVTVDKKVGNVEILEGETREALEVIKSGNTYSADYDLRNGLNSFYVKSKAADGVSEKQYIVNITYTPASDISVDGITLNGTALDDFAEETYEYFYELAADITSLEAVVATSESTNVKISLNGKVVSGNSAFYTDLKDGQNKLVVVATAADGLTKTQYNITVIKAYDSNVDLAEVLLNTKDITDDLMEDDAESMQYVAADEVTITVKPQDSRATVKVMLGDKEIIEDTFNVYKDLNDVTIIVTAADGKTQKEYTLDLEKAVYLSDLDWVSGTTGWATIQKDKSIDGNPIQLPDVEGNAVTFEKGIGTHAESIITYDIANSGYTQFTGYVGVDYEKYSGTYGSVKFVIEVDGEVEFEAEMMQKTAMKEFNVVLPEDAQTITIKALKDLSSTSSDDGWDNWDDHADWADAKFLGEFGEQPEPVPTPDTEAPTKPADVEISEVTKTTATISWTASTDNEGVVKYVVTDEEGNRQEVTGTSVDLTGLTAGTEYTYNVKAVDAAGNESEAESITFTTEKDEPVPTPDTEAPTKPADVEVSEVTKTTATISWTASTDNEGIVGYKVYSGEDYLGTVTDTTVDIEDLISGAEYTFYIIAIDEAGNESEAAEVTFTTEKESVDPEKPVVPEKPTEPEQKPTISSPTTGDSSPVVIWMMLAGVAAIILYAARKRKMR